MMSSFVARKVVNGSMLRNEKGPISIMLEVIDENGSTLMAKTTDGQKVSVHLPNNEPLNARQGNWVEIIGKADGSSTIDASEAILFSEENINFDKESYNMMVLFLNNAKDVFRSG